MSDIFIDLKVRGYQMSKNDVVKSDLCETIERKGKVLDINIFSDGNGGWLLEVIDKYGNSTVWNEPFSTDMAAYIEVIEAIHNEGIDTFINPKA